MVFVSTGFRCFVWMQLILFLFYESISAYRTFSDSDKIIYRDRVKSIFTHSLSGYLRCGFPHDELKPLSCEGFDTWGGYSLTLVDALDTLIIMKNASEFRRIAELLATRLDLDRNINVSVFESNIRVVGGLLSAHLLSRRAGIQLEEGWPCSGPLLRLAENLARRLLPAFDTTTGMPFGTVNLRHGVPAKETPITSVAGVGTFIVEFGALTLLTGDEIFKATAMKALHALWDHRSPLGLIGNHVNTRTGAWVGKDAGIGAGADSYFEYLVKGSILFRDPIFMRWFNEYARVFDRHLRREDWYLWVSMDKGSVTQPVFQSLDAYWPAVLTLTGRLDQAKRSMLNFHQVWRQFGALPEFYNIPSYDVHNNRGMYPLRPELAESAWYLYRATRDPLYLEMALDMLTSIEQIARTPHGFATVKNVKDHVLDDRMESFFLAETLKYLYLIFDESSFIHNTSGGGEVIGTPSGTCIVGAGAYLFNTEAHPLDLSALHCCSAEKKAADQEMYKLFYSMDLLDLLELSLPSELRERVGDRLDSNAAKTDIPEVNMERTIFSPMGNSEHPVGSLESESIPAPRVSSVGHCDRRHYRELWSRSVARTCRSDRFGGDGGATDGDDRPLGEAGAILYDLLNSFRQLFAPATPHVRIHKQQQGQQSGSEPVTVTADRLAKPCHDYTIRPELNLELTCPVEPFHYRFLRRGQVFREV